MGFSDQILFNELPIAERIRSVFTPSIGHYQPLNNLLLNLLYNLFSLNFVNYALLSISLHLLCVFFVYLVARKIFNNTTKGLIAALVFGLLSSTYQTTSWILADVGIHMSTLFALFSLLFFLRWRETLLQRHFIYSIVLLIVSLLFKEIGLGMFLLYAAFLYLNPSKGKNKDRKHSLILLFVASSYVVFRVLMLLSPVKTDDEVLVTQTQSKERLVYNLATIPYKGLVQSIIPSRVLVGSSKVIARLLPRSLAGEYGTTQFDIFVEKRILEAVTILIFIVFLYYLHRLSKKIPKENFNKIFLFPLFLVFFNMPIFALAPEKSGIVTIIDSRNLYLAGVGASLLVVSTFSLLEGKNKRRATYILLGFVAVNVFLLQQDLQFLVHDGFIRKKILTVISKYYPDLPEKAVFYVKSDMSYYGLPENTKILPFQSGFGQTLLIYYSEKESFPHDYYRNRFLWDIASEGYQEYEGRGFGYFRNMESLKDAVVRYKIPLDSIIAFSWSSKIEVLSDITTEVKTELESR